VSCGRSTSILSSGRSWRRGRLANLPRASEVRIGPRASSAEAEVQPKQRKKLEWWIARLKQDVFVGDHIPTDRVPPQLATRSGLPPPLSNAWRFELPLAYRGIYTVQSRPGAGPMALILEILSHKEYDRLFGYR
jgi:hypothetical protein